MFLAPTCHTCLCPFHLFLQEYNHYQIHHRWRWRKQKQYPNPLFANIYLWTKGHQQRDRDSIHMTHPSYQGKKKKKRYLSGSAPAQTTSFLFRSSQPLATWMSTSRTTISRGQKLCWCNYDNSNIKCTPWKSMPWCNFHLSLSMKPTWLLFVGPLEPRAEHVTYNKYLT